MKKNSILLGIGGGIAAYKAVEVASLLRKENWDVSVAMTQAAQHFVTPLTFEAVIHGPVLTDLFVKNPSFPGTTKEEMYPHLYPATETRVFVVLPATADLIAKLAMGLGGDVVCASALSLPNTCQKIFCPAMNVEMWHQDVVQENVRKLEARGWERVGPEEGTLACGTVGLGRMSEPIDIVTAVKSALAESSVLSGKKILILSGPTHEYWDPVRFIGNRSSGKMGKALAEEALQRGASVDFVTGPVSEESLPRGTGLSIHKITSAEEMLSAAKPLSEKSDIWIFAAAVADYTPVEKHDQKMVRNQGEKKLILKPTPDIAAELCRTKKKTQTAIGFALETEAGLTRAREKLKNKKLDAIVCNGVLTLGNDSGHFQFLKTGKKEAEDWGTLNKRECAKKIFHALIFLLQK
jgi:phosphopantothenoylcysteine decarboxylase/phosphopantothenate--cysteine ligase